MNGIETKNTLNIDNITARMKWIWKTTLYGFYTIYRKHSIVLTFNSYVDICNVGIFLVATQHFCDGY